MLSDRNRKLVEKHLGSLSALPMFFATDQFSEFLDAARNEALLEVEQMRAQSQPIVTPKSAIGEAEEPAALFGVAGDQQTLFSRTINPRGYPLHIAVKETDWHSAVGASCFYFAMGKDHKSWGWFGAGTLRALIGALQEAEAFARDPSSEAPPLGSAREAPEDGQRKTNPESKITSNLKPQGQEP